VSITPTSPDVDAAGHRAWERVLSQVRQAREDALFKSATSLLWFRGQESRHELRPTLHRQVDDAMRLAGPPHSPAPLFWDLAQSFYSQYRTRAWSHLSLSEQLDPWLTLSSMRHHGLPTSILDWTTSFGCAVYFALRSPEDSDVAIFVLDPEGLNAPVIGRRGLVAVASDEGMAAAQEYHPTWKHDLDKRPTTTIAIQPRLANARMIAQNSGFTASGWSERILNVDGRIVTKIEVPAIARPAGAAFLRDAGISSATVFPDLHGISLQIQDEWLEQVAAGRRLLSGKGNRGH
jgi:hypothetical protein